MFGLGSLQIAVIAVVGTIILGLGGALWWERHEVAKLTADNAALAADLVQAKAVNDQNVAEVAKIKADAQRAADVTAANHAAQLSRLAKSTAIKQEISRAPASDDAPVSPVLGRVLDRLRERASGVDPAPGSPPVDLGRAAGVPR